VYFVQEEEEVGVPPFHANWPNEYPFVQQYEAEYVSHTLEPLYKAAGPSFTGAPTVSQASVGSESKYLVPMVYALLILAMYRLCRPAGLVAE
jgi:hypothetical protein